MLAAEALRVAKEAVRSAEADQQRAETVRAAGMATDADVLAIKVHVAAVKEQQIRRGYDLQVARAALVEAMGAAPGVDYELTTPLAEFQGARPALAELQKTATETRPETRQAKLGLQMAWLAKPLVEACLAVVSFVVSRHWVYR